MRAIPAIAIVDVGKTNKKLMVYDQSYNLVHQQIKRIPETEDEDGFPSEDLTLLCNVVIELVDEVLADERFEIKVINFTAYGASLVYLDKDGNTLPVLYNYLKSYPEELNNEFFHAYGPPEKIALETASPSLGNLNSGMQLYWLKKHKSGFFKKIHTALHLPQFISYLISHHAYTEKTSIGCHTQLWNFNLNQYHQWVKEEQLDTLFPPIVDSSSSYSIIRNKKQIQVGVGLHDSSSALVPYTTFLEGPFILISTGTWSISLNPFNQDPLTIEELQQDCLCYLQHDGRPVKASRFFLGHFHAMGVEKIAKHFAIPDNFYVSMKYDQELYQRMLNVSMKGEQAIDFDDVDLLEISSPDLAYYAMMQKLVESQKSATKLIFGNVDPEILIVDGGFSQNQIFLHLLKEIFPVKKIFVSELTQSTSLGAALVMHTEWNTQKLNELPFAVKEITIL